LSRLSRTLFAVCVAAVLCAPARPSRGAPEASAAGAAEGQSQLPTLKPSNILDAVRQRKALGPRLSAAGLARYANDLIKQKGFDYNFDVCEIFPPEMLAGGGAGGATGALHTFDRPLTRLDGRGVTFRFVADDYGSPCAECLLPVPALRVTKGEMHVVAGGVVYELKRPAAFVLDEASLVGADLKTVLRTWQLPYQTIPVGVSPDGKSLYVGFYEDTGLDELVLEISDDGRLRFRVTREVVSAEGEWVEEHPTDPRDDYLSFKRFRVGGRTHVVRFSGPCT
jgi:hypothetical protein